MLARAARVVTHFVSTRIQRDDRRSSPAEPTSRRAYEDWVARVRARAPWLLEPGQSRSLQFRPLPPDVGDRGPGATSDDPQRGTSRGPEPDPDERFRAPRKPEGELAGNGPGMKPSQKESARAEPTGSVGRRRRRGGRDDLPPRSEYALEGGPEPSVARSRISEVAEEPVADRAPSTGSKPRSLPSVDSSLRAHPDVPPDPGPEAGSTPTRPAQHIEPSDLGEAVSIPGVRLAVEVDTSDRRPVVRRERQPMTGEGWDGGGSRQPLSLETTWPSLAPRGGDALSASPPEGAPVRARPVDEETQEGLDSSGGWPELPDGWPPEPAVLGGLLQRLDRRRMLDNEQRRL